MDKIEKCVVKLFITTVLARGRAPTAPNSLSFDIRKRTFSNADAGA
jgi:hypothetical protein